MTTDETPYCLLAEPGEADDRLWCSRLCGGSPLP
jgi:hypothetical protein